ncbi:MAG: flagellar biosynthetic protein FliR [Paracoccus sp. (in: a-proteobacteria)]|uniref:flagellar biosynthetic protein FliR n=1 Tax=Paracoccus sp. TaxID=267 RepID=UPI0026DFE864|nr:flagellar biosynthetic protein FliR [Paracoccus sp. (in: a-proteobacteria)]MDO5621674.1 flagellar biosynthetic protein FliR [Paracoccus sp. (in: a-proteobacteria)]
MIWDDLARLVALVDPALIGVHLRILGFLMTLPGYGERLLSVRLRVSVALVLTPLLAGSVAAPVAETGLLALAGMNLLVGIANGLLVRLLAMSLSIATSAIAATASLSQILGGPSEAAPHPIGNFFHLAGLAMLMAMGFPIFAADLMVQSFELWPLDRVVSAQTMGESGAALVVRSFTLAMLLASPFILGGLLYQSLAGVVSRVMPSLPIALIGAPASILLALIALAVLGPAILGVWSDRIFDYGLP